MIKLIASDIDGTIVESGSRNIAPAYFDEIKRLTDAGITFVVASGRQEDSVRLTFEPVLDRVYLLTNNGARLSKCGKVYRDIFIDRGILKPLVEDLRKISLGKSGKDQMAGEIDKTRLDAAHTICDVMLSNAEKLFYFPEASKESLKFTSESYGFTLEPFVSYEKLPEIAKICVFRRGNYPHPALSLSGKYEGISVFAAGSEWVDFMPTGVNKGAALRSLQEKLGIKKEETIAFGDQENDVPMFEASGTSYAVSTAVPIAKEVADKIIPSYKDLGVLGVLKSISLS